MKEFDRCLCAYSDKYGMLIIAVVIQIGNIDDIFAQKSL